MLILNAQHFQPLHLSIVVYMKCLPAYTCNSFVLMYDASSTTRKCTPSHEIARMKYSNLPPVTENRASLRLFISNGYVINPAPNQF